ncbi:helix-turn-helix domain-containing protein [Minwuia sp.]|uniref:helix-turn-helix domain-containing protein n=1 Tax=Minwuia sp. TaxID=2493630 RepID=UPI003A937FAC
MDHSPFDMRLAARLRSLRDDRGWSLQKLEQLSGVSRASLSRLENGEVSPTTQVLARLCNAYGMTLSRLLLSIEDGFEPVVRTADQPVWRDSDAGFERRSVSPPSHALAAEVLWCRLDPGASISYERPPREGMEHHLVMLEGALTVFQDGRTHRLKPGDCLRYVLTGRSHFETGDDAGARYFLFII